MWRTSSLCAPMSRRRMAAWTSSSPPRAVGDLGCSNRCRKTLRKTARDRETPRGRVKGIEGEPFKRENDMAGRHNHHAWPTCNAFARSTGKPCLRKCAVGSDGRPRPRCVGHGGHIKSGVQTVEGRKRIAEATSKRMRAFWEAWRAAGRPPLPWRDSLRTAKRKAPKAVVSWGLPKKTPELRRASAIAELKRLIPGWED
jgi:hypothetical protein